MVPIKTKSVRLLVRNALLVISATTLNMLSRHFTITPVLLVTSVPLVQNTQSSSDAFLEHGLIEKTSTIHLNAINVHLDITVHKSACQIQRVYVYQVIIVTVVPALHNSTNALLNITVWKVQTNQLDVPKAGSLVILSTLMCPIAYRVIAEHGAIKTTTR